MTAEESFERIKKVVRSKVLLGEITVDPCDGSAPIPLEYVLIRGFTAMGWKLPATAAGDMLNAIADAAGSALSRPHQRSGE